MSVTVHVIEAHEKLKAGWSLNREMDFIPVIRFHPTIDLTNPTDSGSYRFIGRSRIEVTPCCGLRSKDIEGIRVVRT